MTTEPLVVLVGDRSATERAHERIERVLPALGVRWRWHASEEVADADDVADGDGIWVVPGSPYRSMTGVLTAIRHAREAGVPYLGTCGGFQHALIEWTRHVLGRPEADDTQSTPDAQLPLITPLSCSMRGERHPLRIAAGSLLAQVYTVQRSTELYHCCYGLNPNFGDLFSAGPLRICAWDDQGEPRAVELGGHPFFIGTLYQPELVSDETVQHRLILAFVAAVRAHARRTTFGVSSHAA